MDASEWEAMKKVEKLLEESLQREQEMSAAVDKLKEEKIQALEDNSKMVTIKKEVTIVETVQCKTQPRLVMERFFGMVANQINHSMERRGRNSHLSSMEVERAWQTSRGVQYFEHEFSHIQDMFFTTKNEMRSCPEREDIIHKGLDEVKADIAR